MTSAVRVEFQGESGKAKGVFSSVADFLKDLHEAYLYSNFSLLSAYYEIKARYATSYLGPIWMVLSNVIFISFISVLYGSIFHIDLDDYVPYLATGYLLWMFMVTVFLDGSSTFIAHGQMLKDYKISPLVIYCRMFYRALIIFAHNLPVILVSIFYFKGFVIDVPMFLLGMSLNLACIFLIGLILSVMACRFRDIYYVLPSIFQVLILVMPILWKPEMLAGRKMIVIEINIIYQMLELVRAPLLGLSVPSYYYMYNVIFMVALFVLAAVMYTRSKTKIVLWT